MPKTKTYEELLGLKKMQEIAEDRLHPPMAPKPIASETAVADVGIKDSVKSSERNRVLTSIPTDSKLAIDFSYLADNSSFQRGILEFIKKYIPGFENVNVRASKDILIKDFNQTHKDYTGVVNEFKAKVAKLRGRKDE